MMGQKSIVNFKTLLHHTLFGISVLSFQGKMRCNQLNFREGQYASIFTYLLRKRLFDIVSTPRLTEQWSTWITHNLSPAMSEKNCKPFAKSRGTLLIYQPNYNWQWYMDSMQQLTVKRGLVKWVSKQELYFAKDNYKIFSTEVSAWEKQG